MSCCEDDVMLMVCFYHIAYVTVLSQSIVLPVVCWLFFSIVPSFNVWELQICFQGSNAAPRDALLLPQGCIPALDASFFSAQLLEVMAWLWP